MSSEEEENKGDDMALAGCGGESMETYLLYVVGKKITKTTTWFLQVVEEKVRSGRPTTFLL